MKTKQIFTGAALALSLMMAGCGETEQVKEPKQQVQNQASKSTQKSEVKSGDTVSVKDLIEQGNKTGIGGARIFDETSGWPQSYELLQAHRNFYICSNQVVDFARNGNIFTLSDSNWKSPSQDDKDGFKRTIYQIKKNERYKYNLPEDTEARFWELANKNKLSGSNWIFIDRQGNISESNSHPPVRYYELMTQHYYIMMFDKLCHKLSDKEREDVREKKVIESKGDSEILAEEPYASYKVGSISAAEKVYPQVMNAMLDYVVDLKKEAELLFKDEEARKQ